MLSRNNPALWKGATHCHQCRQCCPLQRGMGTISNCFSFWSYLILPEHRWHKSIGETPYSSSYVPSWSLVTDVIPAFHQLVGDKFLGRASREGVSLVTQLWLPRVLPKGWHGESSEILHRSPFEHYWKYLVGWNISNYPAGLGCLESQLR